MRLISCKFCGVVFDEDVLDFPVDLYKDNGNGGCVIDTKKAVWLNEGYRPFVTCCICGDQIIKEG